MMLMLTVLTISFFYNSKQVEESFTYFPANPEAFYQSAETSLTLLKDTPKGYELLWRSNSVLNRKAYLRQDISLLYGNGKLISKEGHEWKQNEKKIDLEKIVLQEESANYKAISFHHAEIHEQDQITSSQNMTHDELYILDSKFHPLHSFRQPIHKQDEEWKKLIDNYIEDRLYRALEKANRMYSFDLDQYTTIPLTSIYQYEEVPLPGFNKEQTQAIIGRLWEGLYKNYFLGVKKQDGTTIDPIGSTIPLILVSTDQTHLLVVSELKDDDIMLLKQQIPHG
jgi:hypothetical protein